jgi:hypothetical protein
MKLKEYVDNLVKLLEDNSEYGELDVVYSKDDEGNGYQGVHYTPTIGSHDVDEGEFIPFNEDPDVDPCDTCTKEEINAICIN